MAYLAQNNKVIGSSDPSSQPGGASQPGAQPQGAGQSVPISGSGGSDVISGGSNQPGAGGQGSWTNIQAYLGANKGDTGSSNLLSNQANDTFGKEQANVDQQSQNAQSQAKSQADQVNFSQDQASKLLSQAGQNYSYNGPQSDAYNSAAGQLKGALNATYQGPTSFSYQMGSNAQNLGDNLNNQAGFGQVMNNLYNQAGGGQMSPGQLALQSQLDVGNQSLNQARQNAIGQYSNLQGYAGNATTSADQAIQNYQTQFGQNQTNLKSLLNTDATQAQSGAQAAEDQAKSAYQNAFTTGQSGIATGTNPLAQLVKDGSSVDYDNANLSNYGPVSGNATWQQLQNQNDSVKANPGMFSQDWWNGIGGLSSTSDASVQSLNQANQNYSAGQNALQNFYNTQEATYANTGDDQKGQYNSIMDILGNSNRLSQGYDVGAPAKLSMGPGRQMQGGG